MCFSPWNIKEKSNQTTHELDSPFEAKSQARVQGNGSLHWVVFIVPEH